MRLIDADDLKDGAYINKGNFNTVEGIREWIDNAPTVSEITKEKLAIAYEQGYEDGKNNWLQEERPQGDLISREALKKHITEIFETEEKYDKKWAMGLKYSLKLIDNAPTVAPEKALMNKLNRGYNNGKEETT